MICRFASSTTKNIDMADLGSHIAYLQKYSQARFKVFQNALYC